MEDLIKANGLKFFYQMELGSVDGLIVAFHNCVKLLGFMYIPKKEWASCVFSSRLLHSLAFDSSALMVQDIFDYVRSKTAIDEEGVKVTLDFQIGKSICFFVATHLFFQVDPFFFLIKGQVEICVHRNDILLGYYRHTSKSMPLYLTNYFNTLMVSSICSTH